jgi:hypothetical protein
MEILLAGQLNNTSIKVQIQSLPINRNRANVLRVVCISWSRSNTTVIASRNSQIVWHQFIERLKPLALAGPL